MIIDYIDARTGDFLVRSDFVFFDHDDYYIYVKKENLFSVIVVLTNEHTGNKGQEMKLPIRYFHPANIFNPTVIIPS